MRSCRRLVAELGMTGGEERMMELVGRRDAFERRDGVAIAVRNKIGSPEMVPKPLGMIGIEAHGLLDPLDALLGLSEPGQDLAVLHDNKVVVGVETECALLMVDGLVVMSAGQIHGGENPVDIAVVAVEL